MEHLWSLRCISLQNALIRILPLFWISELILEASLRSHGATIYLLFASEKFVGPPLTFRN